jgi:predicted metal-dependent peptidase
METISNKKVHEALISLLLHEPFFAALLLQQNFIEDNQQPTFAVDGKNLYFNSEFAESLKFDEIKAVLVHEALHLILLHHCRQGARDNQKWNEACDYAINLEIQKTGYCLPKGALINHAYANKSAEDIYRLLPTPPPSSSPSPSCGSVIKNKDSVKQEEETKIQITKALNQAKAWGNVPAGIESLVKESLIPKADWKSILSRFLNELCNKNYSWSRPNRRFVSSDFFLPSLYSKTMGKIVVARDTSGSMSQKESNEIVAEIHSILELMQEDKNEPIELLVIDCDSKVQNVQNITSDTEAIIFKGGGGTAFSPVFNYLEDNNIEPEALIYLTDGFCDDFWNKTPNYPVLWGLIVDNKNFQPPFGENVLIHV